MTAAIKLLPLLKDKRVQHVLEGLVATLILIVTALGTTITGHNLQWYGNNTVAEDFTPQVSNAYEKIDEGNLDISLLYSAYITLFDNGNEYPHKEDVRTKLIGCFYRTEKKSDEDGKKYNVTEAIEDDNVILNNIEKTFNIKIDAEKREYIIGLKDLFGSGSSYLLSGTVTQYYELIAQYCNKYGISDYIPLIEAVMQQESGGNGGDPMQCSESPYNTKYSKSPNSITDPEYSIDIGTRYLASCLHAAGCKSPDDTAGISLALQGYNFGNGYISWALGRGGYTVQNAVEFSQLQMEKLGWSGYGDVDYVSHVLRYYHQFQSGSSGAGGFIYPISAGQYRISSGYGARTDPTAGGTEFHKGVDLAAASGTDIHAGAAGTVIYAQYASHPYSGYGNLVIIRHSSSLVSMYGHCSKLLVSVGQTVQQGQTIAQVGSTGDSTGNHCHFEIRVNGASTNPMPYLS